MADKALYDTLGVKPSASDDEIKRAYRKLAKTHHPDLNPDDAEAEKRFKEVSAAFAILGDEDKRRRYDAGEIDESGAERPEHAFYRQQAGGPGGQKYQSWHTFQDSGPDLSSVFDDLFGGRAARGRRGPMRGADVNYSMEVEFLDAAKGVTTTVTMPDGKQLRVKIPPGTRDGQRLRLKGQGQASGGGAQAGDAYVEIRLKPDALFTTDGNDVHVTIGIGIDEAALGAKVPVPTIDGTVMVTVPKGANSGQTLRLKGKGLKSGDTRGDQLVHLDVVMPETIDSELAEFLSEWRERHAYDPRLKRRERAKAGAGT
ncbi:MAG: J domain-containing protein [Pseudomonadota bacterium]